MTEEIRSYIDDNIRKSTDSAVKAMTEISRSIQVSVQAIDDRARVHREEEIDAREVHRENMMKVVETQIVKTVNGKLDKLSIKMDGMDEKITRIDSATTPLIKDYTEKKIVGSFFKRKERIAIGVGGAIITITSAWFAIKEFFK